MNDYVLLQNVQQHRRDLEAQAEHERLVGRVRHQNRRKRKPNFILQFLISYITQL